MLSTYNTNWTPETESSLNAQLLKAARDGELAKTKQLLTYPVDLNTQDAAGWTPLIHASYHGHAGVVRALISTEHGLPRPNIEHTIKPNGATALHLGCARGQLQVVLILLHEAKSHINARDFDLATPLHAAVLGGHPPVVQLLVANGAKVSMLDKHVKTPMDWAVERGQMELVNILNRSPVNCYADNDPIYYPGIQRSMTSPTITMRQRQLHSGNHHARMNQPPPMMPPPTSHTPVEHVIQQSQSPSISQSLPQMPNVNTPLDSASPHDGTLSGTISARTLDFENTDPILDHSQTENNGDAFNVIVDPSVPDSGIPFEFDVTPMDMAHSKNAATPEYIDEPTGAPTEISNAGILENAHNGAIDSTALYPSQSAPEAMPDFSAYPTGSPMSYYFTDITTSFPQFNGGDELAKDRSFIPPSMEEKTPCTPEFTEYRSSNADTERVLHENAYLKQQLEAQNHTSNQEIYQLRRHNQDLLQMIGQKDITIQQLQSKLESVQLQGTLEAFGNGCDNQNFSITQPHTNSEWKTSHVSTLHYAKENGTVVSDEKTTGDSNVCCGDPSDGINGSSANGEDISLGKSSACDVIVHPTIDDRDDFPSLTIPDTNTNTNDVGMTLSTSNTPSELVINQPGNRSAKISESSTSTSSSQSSVNRVWNGNGSAVVSRSMGDSSSTTPYKAVKIIPYAKSNSNKEPLIKSANNSGRKNVRYYKYTQTGRSAYAFKRDWKWKKK